MTFASTKLFDRIQNFTPLSKAELAILITTAPSRYKVHTIVKRNGRGNRIIAQPTAELKFIQRMLVQHEFASFKLNGAVTAYSPGLSIVDHAKPHAKNRYLLKLDFENFFPSLKSFALEYCLRRLEQYSDDEIRILVMLLCRWNRKDSCLELSIGAPSSPFISNWILTEFDDALADFCKTNGITYTRYADDLALSSSQQKSLDKAQIFIEELLGRLRYLGLKLNDKKTVNVSKKFSRQLVGLVLANDGTVSIGRNKKRSIRAAVHAMTLGKLTPTEKEKLKGQLAFCISVDPKFVDSLCAHYETPNIVKLFELSGSFSPPKI